jgi:hypothetical protein
MGIKHDELICIVQQASLLFCYHTTGSCQLSVFYFIFAFVIYVDDLTILTCYALQFSIWLTEIFFPNHILVF